jgi:tetratricopeptide (TPR) repeat protein
MLAQQQQQQMRAQQQQQMLAQQQQQQQAAPPAPAYAPSPSISSFVPPAKQANLFTMPPAQSSFSPPPGQAALFSPPPPQGASGGGSMPPLDVQRRPPPSTLPPDLKFRWQEIETKAAKIDKEDFFQMLELERNANDPQIQAAYFKVAKLWHPDRMPSELADLKPLVSKVFTKFNEAYATLSDATKRTEYVKTLDLGGGTSEEAEQVQRVVDAAIEFQKAEVLLKKNDLAQAEIYAQNAMTADPEQVEYQALVHWIKAMRRGDPPPLQEGKTTSFYDDLIMKFDDILKVDAMFERALYYRAVLLKRSGREEKAQRDFKMVVQLNPKNIDAVREVRLAQMRRDKKRSDEAGLLGKLFKK